VAQHVVRVCALNGIGFVVVPIRVLQAQIWMGVIAGGNHVCKMCPGALVGMLGVLIFDKRAFALEMCVFGAFFLNQVGFAGLKVGGMNELERSHIVCISDAYYTNLGNLSHFCSIFYEFLSNYGFGFVKSVGY
jgi:hypothetical protein